MVTIRQDVFSLLLNEVFVKISSLTIYLEKRKSEVETSDTIQGKIDEKKVLTFKTERAKIFRKEKIQRVLY